MLFDARFLWLTCANTHNCSYVAGPRSLHRYYPLQPPWSLSVATSPVIVLRNLHRHYSSQPPRHCPWQPPSLLSVRGNLLRHCPSMATSFVTVRPWQPPSSLSVATSLVTVRPWQPPSSLSVVTSVVTVRGNLLRHCPSVATSVVTVRGNLFRHCPWQPPSSLSVRRTPQPNCNPPGLPLEEDQRIASLPVTTAATVRCGKPVLNWANVCSRT